MATSWCKVASNLDSHPKIRRAGRNGREVFLFALRRNAEPNNPIPGRLPIDQLEPWYLADQLQMPECDAVTGVTAAVTAGLLKLDGNSYIIVGWEEDWSKLRTSGAARTARWRDNKRLPTAAPSHVTAVTSPVTPSDACDTDQIRLDQTRGDKRSVESSSTDRSSLEFAAFMAQVREVAERTAKPKAKRKPPNPDHAPAKAEWFAFWGRRSNGQEPTWGAKQGSLLGAFLSQHGLEEFKRRVALLESSRDPWHAQWDFAAFISHSDRLVSVAPKQSSAGRVEPSAPNAYPDGEVTL